MSFCNAFSSEKSFAEWPFFILYGLGSKFLIDFQGQIQLIRQLILMIGNDLLAAVVGDFVCHSKMHSICKTL